MTTLHIHPDYRAALEAEGLANFDALFAAGQDNRIDGHRHRSVSRLELKGADGRPQVIYLKRQWGIEARPAIRDFLEGRWPELPARREWNNVTRLVRAGVPVSPPVAWGVDKAGREPRALIAFAEVSGTSLARWIDRQAQSALAGVAARERHGVAVAVGRAVRRLHDAGFSFPDLYGKHLFLENAGSGQPRVVLIDVQRLRGRRPGYVAEDFAALYASTDEPGVTRSDRLRVFRAYMGQERLPKGARSLIRKILFIAGRKIGRGKDPNIIHTRQAELQPGLQEIDGGRLRVADSVRPALEAAGLATFDALMQFNGGRLYRDKDGRSTVRLELTVPDGGRKAFFLKRYTRVPWRLKLRRTFALNATHSLAEIEARSIVRVTNLSISTMRRVAVGEEITSGGRSERSCILTEEITGQEADGYIERTFAKDTSRPAVAAKRRLISQLADIARRFHGNNLTHRDFYLCHFLVQAVEGQDPRVHLIDLQRVEHYGRGLGRRWLVKDLGSLLFSSRPGPGTRIASPVLSRTDAMRFAHAYFGVRHLTDDQKSLVRSAIAKARAIARREPRRRRKEARQ
jgi:heptose I phosphotransferase